MEYIALMLLILPAGIANSIPPIVSKVPFLMKYDTPVDLGRSWRGIRIFGDHKTIRGFVLGSIGAGLLSMLIFAIPYFGDLIRESLEIYFNSMETFVFGLLTGFGSLVGDAVKSFFKRRVGIKSGQSWFPFDQTDYIVGGLLVFPLFVSLSLGQYAFIAVFSFFLHFLGTTVGYFMGVKDSWI